MAAGEDTMAVPIGDSMEDTIIMGDLFSALAQDFGRDIIRGTIHGITQGTPQGITQDTIQATTMHLLQSMTHPRLLSRLPLHMLNLHQLPKILALTIPYLRLQQVRFHQVLTKEGAKSGHQPASITTSRVGIRRTKQWKAFQFPISLGKIIPASNPFHVPTVVL